MSKIVKEAVMSTHCVDFTQKFMLAYFLTINRVSLCCDCLLATEICCDIVTSLLQRFYDTIPFSKASKRRSLTELQKATI